MYLGRRDFVDHISHVDPIDGVVLVDPEYLNGRKVFGHVLAAFRYGREDLDVLGKSLDGCVRVKMMGKGKWFLNLSGLSGLTFRKDLYLASSQIYPPLEENKKPLTRLQERLIKKLGENAHPFYFELPPHCPASVTLQPAPGDTGKPCGIDYEMKAFVGDSQDDKPHKRNSVRLAIRKVLYSCEFYFVWKTRQNATMERVIGVIWRSLSSLKNIQKMYSDVFLGDVRPF